MPTEQKFFQPRPRGIYRALVGVAAAMAVALGPAFADEGAGGAGDLDAYRVQGLQAAMQTKGALGGELMKAIEAGGPEGAVAFCNTRAIPITREMSSKLGLQVSRVSDRPRNPDNAANETERAVIARFKEALARGEPPSPALREHGDQVIGYYPIVTNAMCLQCHGARGVDISAATQAVIDRQYPMDRATGYGVNQLRGLFVVAMDRDTAAAGETP